MTINTAPKKITLATLKRFVKQNADRLLIQVRSDFCGMSDCVVETQDRSFVPVCKSDRSDLQNLGIQGVWLVLGSRDYFRPFFNESYSGIEVSNCCGTFVLAVKQEGAS